MGWWRLQRPAPGPSAQPRPVVQVREVPYGQAPAGPWRVPGPEWSCRARGGELRNRGWATRPIRTRSMGRGPGPACGCRKVPDQPEDPSGRGGGGGGQIHLLLPAWGHRAPGPQGQGGGCVWAASPLTPQEGGEKGRLLRPALWLPVSLSFIFSKYHAMNTLRFAPMTKRKPQVLVFKVKINRWNLGLRRGPSPCSRPTSRMRRGLGPAQRLEPHLSSVAARLPPTQAQNKARLLCP